MATNVIDWSDPNANMYGCQDCPKCESKYRASYNRPDGTVKIMCDCGFVEPAEFADEEERE